MEASTASFGVLTFSVSGLRVLRLDLSGDVGSTAFDAPEPHIGAGGSGNHATRPILLNGSIRLNLLTLRRF